MSLSSSAVAAQPAAESIPSLAPVALPFEEGVLELESSMHLHFGGRLDKPHIAWSLTGPSDAPVVIALGGISAGRTVVTNSNEQKGWWSEIVGPARALDATHWRILGIDYLGGSAQSTGPKAGQTNFPSISAYDQAEAVRRVIEQFRLGPVAAIVGASYGGMVALAFAERFPQLVRRIVVISAADRSHPMSTAWRSVQRAIVRYASKHGDAPEGLRLGRALAMATYRSPEEFATRFDGPAVRIDGRFQFPVESYLLARGDAYASTYVPEAFVCLSESIDLHRVNPANIRVPTTLVAVREDQLVPLGDMQSLRDRIAAPTELAELSSVYGHDAFLKESEALKRIFTRALATQGGVQ